MKWYYADIPKVLIIVSCILILICLLFPRKAQGGVYEDAQNVVVGIGDPATGRIGGAVLVSSNRAVTSLHIVQESTDVVVRFKSGRVFAGKVLVRDKDNDLALIHIESDTPHPVARIDLGPLELGQDIFMIGHPNGLHWSLSKGYVMYSTERPVKFDGENATHVIQADITGFSGSSGGGMFNEKGDLIGIVKGRINQTCITYFVPSSALCKKVLTCEVKR